MARRRGVHVLPKGGGWVIRAEGLEEGTPYSTQQQAAQLGRQLARQQGTDFVLHARDGRVRSTTRYRAS